MSPRRASGELASEAESWRTIPNLITLLRILLIFPFCYFVTHGGDMKALGIFVLAGISDTLDGTLARRLNQTSKIGRLVDPVADKVLTGIAYVALAAFREGRPAIPMWVMEAAVARDILILLGCWIVYQVAHETGFKPTVFGKLNTFIELGVIAWFLTSTTMLPDLAAALPVLYVLMAVSIVVSFAGYTRQGIGMLVRQP